MRNLEIPKNAILILALLVVLIRLVMSVLTGYYSCYNCFGYPEWWKYAYPAKLAIAIILLIFALKDKKWAHIALTLMILLTGVTILVYESNVIEFAVYLLFTFGYYRTFLHTPIDL